MSKKAQYSDYVVLRGSGEVFELVVPSVWEIVDTVLVFSRYGKELAFPKNNLIRIPNEFTAYIKSDTLCHCLNGTMQVLRVDLEDSEENFYNPKDESGIWFVASDRWVPLRDIDLSTFFSHDSSFDNFIIPPMPSLDELQKCSIHYEGHKTIVTYCDAFVGEAICHKDDEFKVGSGIAIAYSRAKEAKDEYDAKQEEKKIKVGDVVKVVDAGQNFSSYYEKVAEICQKINNMYACARYAYEERLFDSEDQHDEFKVLYIDEDYAYIENVDNWKCRLVTPQAICKAELFKETKIDDEIDWEDDDLW